MWTRGGRSMRFNIPPGWPAPPESWLPDAGWRPDPTWPTAPTRWAYWTDDAGRAVTGPAGLYPNGSPSRRPKVLLGAGAGLAGILLGIAMGAGSPNASSAVGLTGEPAPVHTVTSTVTTPGETVTSLVTTPGETVTSTVTAPGPRTTVAGPTITRTIRATTVRTVRATVTVPAPFVDTGGDDGGSAYYANCSEARAAGVAPLYRGDPGYRSGLDRDNDGVACE